MTTPTFKIWTKDEEQQLLQEVEANKSIGKTAFDHGRSKKAIALRLQKILTESTFSDDFTLKTQSMIDSVLNEPVQKELVLDHKIDIIRKLDKIIDLLQKK